MLVLNLLNKIFGKKGDLSRKDINSYIKKGADDNDIEKKALSDDFNADALEGFSTQNLDESAMNSLDKKMDKKFTSSSSTTILLIAASLFIGIGVAAYFKFSQPMETSYKLAVNEIDLEKVEEIETEEIPEKETKDDKVLEKQVQQDEPQILQESKDFVPEEEEAVISSNERREDVSRGMPAMAENESVESVNLPPRQSNVPTANKSNSGLHYKNVKEVYLSGFKLVDYREFRDGDDIENEELIGTPASHETPNKKEAFLNDESENTIAYIDFMEDAMRILSIKNHSLALNKYKTVLKTYPDDVNANFYAGYANFQLNNYEAAIEHFSKSYSITFGNFREEARFLTAKSYLAQNKNVKAKKIFTSIIEEGGFYAEEARKLME